MAVNPQSLDNRYPGEITIGDDDQPSIKPQQRASRPVSSERQAVSKGYQPSSNRSKTRIRPSAIISGEAIDRGRPLFERSIGIALLFLSFACTVMTFNGYWGIPSIKALVIGIGLQGLATAAEWFWRNQRMSLWYVGAIVFDAGMSIKGFSIPLLSPFKRAVDNIGIIPDNGVSVVAWGLIILLSIALAVLPEIILIDKD